MKIASKAIIFRRISGWLYPPANSKSRYSDRRDLPFSPSTSSGTSSGSKPAIPTAGNAPPFSSKPAIPTAGKSQKSKRQSFPTFSLSRESEKVPQTAIQRISGFPPGEYFLPTQFRLLLQVRRYIFPENQEKSVSNLDYEGRLW